MKRAFWIGLALVALAAAPALWLVLDDGGDRSVGALVEPTGGGDVGTLTLTASKSGIVTVPVQSFSWGVTVPRDPATGLPTAKARLEPLQLFRPVDAASPLLFQILTMNETISSAKLDLVGTDPATGKAGTYMTYTFANGVLSNWDDTSKRGSLALHYQTASVKLGVFPPPALKAVGQMTVSSLGSTPIPISDFATGVQVPIDPATGLPSGKRQHKPVTIRRALDAHSPTLLANAQSGKLLLGTVTVELQRPSSTGKIETYATYVFGNATIASVEDAGATGPSAPTQELKLGYETMEVKVGSILATDTWSASAG